jgi:vancomycin aglycone glucosyltransferase
MRVGLVVSGSRGDVQPMLAVAVGIRDAGHDAVVFSSPDNAGWAHRLGCSFVSVGEPLRENASLTSWGARDFDPFIRHQTAIQARDLPGPAAGCDVLVASGLAFGVPLVAERLRIPYRYVSFVPASFLGTTRDPIGTRLMRAAADRYADLRYGRTLGAARRSLGLGPAHGVMRQLMGRDTIAATDPALTVLPAGTTARTCQTGYPVLRQRGELSAELRRFLDAGQAPVYAGFGSMPIRDPERVSRLLTDAAEGAGQRIVVSRGWAHLPESGHRDRCLFVDDEPHDLLFPLVNAVVHHGGAGTVATAARSGVPQIVLPTAADQFLWRGAVAKLGLGPRTPILRFASSASLAAALTTTLTDPTYRQRAREVAVRIAASPDGVVSTVAEIVATR